MSDKIEYWLDLAEYDLETARAMLKTRRYLYVGFMCHQVIEKGLKACFAFVMNDFPPYTRNLLQLAEKSGIVERLNQEQLDFIDYLQPFNIEARYPSYKEKLLQTLNEIKCKRILKNTEDLYQWIKVQFLNA